MLVSSALRTLWRTDGSFACEYDLKCYLCTVRLHGEFDIFVQVLVYSLLLNNRVFKRRQQIIGMIQTFGGVFGGAIAPKIYFKASARNVNVDECSGVRSVGSHMPSSK